MGNTNLRSAASNKKDEFYTSYEDVDDELRYYTHHFDNKVIYCSCDDYKTSNFFKYFVDNFNQFNLKKVIATGFSLANGEGVGAVYDGELTILHDVSGKFQDNLEFLDESDIVITNPPFSIFREFHALLSEKNKDFIVLGNLSALTYKGFFEYIQSGEVELSHKSARQRFFVLHPSYEKYDHIDDEGNKVGKIPNSAWYSTLDSTKPRTYLKLSKTFDEVTPPKFDNYDAVNIDKSKLVPIDYLGVMGVPISFLNVYNPDEFEIIDGIGRYSILNNKETKKTGMYLSMVDGKAKYFRIIIKRKAK